MIIVDIWKFDKEFFFVILFFIINGSGERKGGEIVDGLGEYRWGWEIEDGGKLTF